MMHLPESANPVSILYVTSLDTIMGLQYLFL